jgi:hypothetical protein
MITSQYDVTLQLLDEQICTMSTGSNKDSIFKKFPGGFEIFRTRPDRLWGPPSPLYDGYRVFPGG